ncbi:MAG: TolC family protein, partial [Rhodothermales bacterium]
RLDVDNANAQVREAWGQVMPQLDVQSSYTRNLKSANPFAGSEAGGLFASFGFIDWLSYNEKARTDTDLSTNPISLDEFGDKRQEGLDNAGIVLGGSDNPFSVPNEFQNGLSVSQTIFSGSAFAAIKGAEQLKAINSRGVDRQEQLLIDNVRKAFYAALLASERTYVAQQSVSRIQHSLDDATRRVAQGVTPKYERLTAEVELANLQTQLLEVQNNASSALDNLKLQLGVPVNQPVLLRGELRADDAAGFMNISTDDAVDLALERRPDLEQARLAIKLREIDRSLVKSRYLPALTAFANLNYLGRVPDDRTRVISDGDDPFSFSQSTNRFFSQSYWNPSVNAGLRLTWSIFNGFQTSSQIQQKQIAVEKAEIEHDRTIELVRLEVQNALRNVETARRRIQAQEQNVQKAELNYEYASARLAEGVASHLEERNASEQLDISRWNYLQAVHDFLVAKSAFETAVGASGRGSDSLKLTSN